MPDHLIHLQAVQFEAARRLPLAPAERAETRLHGHGFRSVAGATTLPVDFAGRARAMDYQPLHEFLPDASDLGVLRHLAADLPASACCALQGAPGQGVRRAADGRHYAWRMWQFESAHHLPNVPPGHKCGRLHGHGFRAVLHVPVLDPAAGWNAEQARLEAAWAPVHARIHQRYLNDLVGLDNPTSEWLAVWLWRALLPALPDLAWVTVYETASCGAHFDGAVHRIWKDFTIDSASLQDAVMSGHTWTLRLQLAGELHPVFGWAMDFAEVKHAFDPLFRALDHQPLHAVDGLTTPDSAGIAHYIRRHADRVLPALGRVDVLDGCGGGVSLDWGCGGLQALPEA